MKKSALETHITGACSSGNVVEIFIAASALVGYIDQTQKHHAGLMLDVVHGTILGQHAIGMLLVAFFVLMQHQRMRVSSLLQQALVVLGLLFLKTLLVLWVDGMVGRSSWSWLYFAPCLISAIIWPWVFIILRDLRRKFVYRAM